jgi:hypothetical protein
MVSEQKTNTLIILEQSTVFSNKWTVVDRLRDVVLVGRLEMGRARNQNF